MISQLRISEKLLVVRLSSWVHGVKYCHAAVNISQFYILTAALWIGSLNL